MRQKRLIVALPSGRRAEVLARGAGEAEVRVLSSRETLRIRECHLSGLNVPQGGQRPHVGDGVLALARMVLERQ